MNAPRMNAPRANDPRLNPAGMTARSPEDILAAVPIVLGFSPEESVVMLTFGGAECFHARVDLPASREDRTDVALTLVRPAVRHGVGRALFVLYAISPDRAAACARELVRCFHGHAIDVVEVLRADGRQWWRVPLEKGRGEGRGVPYDLAGHVFTARAVASGRVTRSSRTELAATVAADPEAVRSVSAVLVRGPAHEPGEEVAAMVARLVASGDAPTAHETARILEGVQSPAGRDAVLAGVDRRDAGCHVDTWSALVRAAPPEKVAAAASVLAFLAWLAGDGALAWCAIDRAGEGSVPCTLRDRVADALEQALPPSVWEAVR